MSPRGIDRHAGYTRLQASLPQMRDDLAELVAIPSVTDPDHAEEGAPFGRAMHEVLNLALRHARRLGLRTYAQPQGYYGYAEIGAVPTVGTRGVRIDIPVHLDVVTAPHPEEWESGDPFTLMTRHDAARGGELFIGRGAIDDKGPAVMALHVLSALKPSRLHPDVTVRVMFSLGEESGNGKDIACYKADHGYPDVALVPDYFFPWVVEQSFVFTRTTGTGRPLPKRVYDPHGVRIESIDTGENARNCVPASVAVKVSARDKSLLVALRSRVDVAFNRSFADALAVALPEVSDRERADIIRKAQPVFSEITSHEGRFHMGIEIKGIASHACQAWKGVNAVRQLAVAMGGMRMDDTVSARALYMVQDFIRKGWIHENSGYFLGVDEESRATHGTQTFSIGVFRAGGDGATMMIDNRVRVGATVEGTAAGIAAITAHHGFDTEIARKSTGITPPTDHPVLSVMREAIIQEAGAFPPPRIEGGGTLARAFNDPQDPLQLSICFGISPPDEPLAEHKPDEFIAAGTLLRGAGIYYRTLHRLAAGVSPLVALRMMR